MTGMRLVVTGIGTDVGKTVASAILVEALKANYWKPIQAGDLNLSDSMKVKGLAPSAKILPEAYRLSTPKSPHAAASDDGVQILLENLTLPDVNPLIVEGAGGLMVPLNEEALTFLDVIAAWKLPVVLVSRHYLGSINHTLLSLEALRQRGIELCCILFIGHNPETEAIIRKGGGVKHAMTIPETDYVHADFVQEQAKRVTAFFNSLELNGRLD